MSGDRERLYRERSNVLRKMLGEYLLPESEKIIDYIMARWSAGFSMYTDDEGRRGCDVEDFDVVEEIREEIADALIYSTEIAEYVAAKGGLSDRAIAALDEVAAIASEALSLLEEIGDDG